MAMDACENREVPLWRDKKRVCEWINAALDTELNATLEIATRIPIPYEVIAELRTQNAIDGAARGDRTPLSKLLKLDEPIAPKVRAFLANLLTGKYKRRRGRPKLSLGLRLNSSRAHLAAADFRRIRKLLREHYPEHRAIPECALEIAACRWEISGTALGIYLKRLRDCHLDPEPSL
jgi:hypothetical protein